MMRPPLTVVGLALAVTFASSAAAPESLPFPPTPSGSTAGLTMKDSTYKKRVEPKRLADGAPNILIILMDDMGPGTPSTYGGEINTPTLDRVAKMGVSEHRRFKAPADSTRGAGGAQKPPLPGNRALQSSATRPGRSPPAPPAASRGAPESSQ